MKASALILFLAAATTASAQKWAEPPRSAREKLDADNSRPKAGVLKPDHPLGVGGGAATKQLASKWREFVGKPAVRAQNPNSSRFVVVGTLSVARLYLARTRTQARTATRLRRPFEQTVRSTAFARCR